MDKKLEWKTLKSTEGPHLKIFDVRWEDVRHKYTGKVSKVVILDSADSCNVVAITPDQKVIMVRQFRFGIGRPTLEIPGGFVDSGEDPMTAVKRELKEETGYTSRNWIYLGKMPSNGVFQSSYIHHFVAYDAVKTENVKFDDAEYLELKLIPLDKIKDGLRNLRFEHPHTVSALVLLKDVF